MTGQRRSWLISAGLGIVLGASGCQTWVPEAAMTLPSGYYLEHKPQYIPPSPAFPLERELATLEEATARQLAPPPGVGLPPPGIILPPPGPVPPPGAAVPPPGPLAP